MGTCSLTPGAPDACCAAGGMLGAERYPDRGSADSAGRQRLNIHGAIDLETGHTRMLEVETIDAVSYDQADDRAAGGATRASG